VNKNIRPNIKPEYRCGQGQLSVRDIKPDFQLNIHVSCKMRNKQRHHMCFLFIHLKRRIYLHLKHLTVSRRYFFGNFINSYGYGISSIGPDIRLVSVSSIWPDIRQGKSFIWPYTGYQKRPDYPASRLSGASLLRTH
jgi:hypothetical protein